MTMLRKNHSVKIRGTQETLAMQLRRQLINQNFYIKNKTRAIDIEIHPVYESFELLKESRRKFQLTGFAFLRVHVILKTRGRSGTSAKITFGLFLGLRIFQSLCFGSTFFCACITL